MEDQALEPPRPALSFLKGGFGLMSFVEPIPSKANEGLSAAGPTRNTMLTACPWLLCLSLPFTFPWGFEW